jgi:hypothetical protein
MKNIVDVLIWIVFLAITWLFTQCWWQFLLLLTWEMFMFLFGMFCFGLTVKRKSDNNKRKS